MMPALVLALFAAGGGDEVTQLVVVLESDYAPGAELIEVEIETLRDGACVDFRAIAGERTVAVSDQPLPVAPVSR